MDSSLIPVLSIGSNEGHEIQGDFKVVIKNGTVYVWSLLHAVLKGLDALNAQRFLLTLGEDQSPFVRSLGWHKDNVLAARDLLYWQLVEAFPNHVWHLKKDDPVEFESWELVP